jgi:hypothetical protein
MRTREVVLASIEPRRQTPTLPIRLAAGVHRSGAHVACITGLRVHLRRVAVAHGIWPAIRFAPGVVAPARHNDAVGAMLGMAPPTTLYPFR